MRPLKLPVPSARRVTLMSDLPSATRLACVCFSAWSVLTPASAPAATPAFKKFRLERDSILSSAFSFRNLLCECEVHVLDCFVDFSRALVANRDAVDARMMEGKAHGRLA